MGTGALVYKTEFPLHKIVCTSYEAYFIVSVLNIRSLSNKAQWMSICNRHTYRLCLLKVEGTMNKCNLFAANPLESNEGVISTIFFFQLKIIKVEKTTYWFCLKKLHYEPLFLLLLQIGKHPFLCSSNGLCIQQFNHLALVFKTFNVQVFFELALHRIENGEK